MKNYPKGRNWGGKILALVTIVNLVLAGLVFAAGEGGNISQRSRAPGIISIDPDQEEWAYPDNTISLNLTVTNIISGNNDYIDLDYNCVPNGWPVQLLKGDGTYQPLTNNGGAPTLVDVGPINNAQAVDITVNVTIPLQPVYDYEYINLTAQSTNNPAGFDNATLRINIYPYLLVRKTLDPPIIYLKDCEQGAPNETTVHLELKGSGMPWEELKPQDTVFIIDNSGSMAWHDPNNLRLNATRDYIDNLTDDDRVALVSCGHDYDLQPNPDAWWINPPFQSASNYVPVGWLTDDMNTPNSTAKTPHHLTNMTASGKTLMKNDLMISLNAGDHPVYEDLGGGYLVGVPTNLEMAIQFAHEELIPGYIAKVTTGPPRLDVPARFFTSDFSPGAKGNPNHQWLEILVTDGLPSAWFGGDNPANYTLDEVQCAAENNTKIFTIGLLGAVPEPEKTQAEDYLKSMANATGGSYYYADQPEDLLQVFDNISLNIVNVVAKPDLISGEPMVTDMVPPHIEVNTSSFSVPPIFYFEHPITGVKKIQWDVSDIAIDEEWNVSYKINSTKAGLVNITHSSAYIRYISWDDKQLIVPVPDAPLEVVYLRPPLNLTLDGINVNDVILSWENSSVGFGVDQYLVYGGTSPTALDFNNPIGTTTNINWVHTGIRATASEYYYVLRAKNTTLGGLSLTSNTVGYWTRQFSAGLTTFSLPLEPFVARDVSWYADDMPNVDYIRWLETDGNWVRHDASMAAGTNDNAVVVGSGYEIALSAAAPYTFYGRPGASIRYLENRLTAPTGFNLTVNITTGTANLTWDPVAGADHYLIYRSDNRAGLNDLDLAAHAKTSLNRPQETWYEDPGAAAPGSNYYYTVAAVRFAGVAIGYNSTYSIGLVTLTYSPGYNTLAMPLRSAPENAVGWYCEQLDEILGMQYLASEKWRWHSKDMPVGVFDELVRFGYGYQVAIIGGNDVYYSFYGI